MSDVGLGHLEAVSSGNSTASKAGAATGVQEVPNYWAVLLILGRNSDFISDFYRLLWFSWLKTYSFINCVINLNT